MSNKGVYLDKRVRRTKKLLHQALLNLMEQKDFKDISIMEIVREADVNRGTFYNHYQFKEDLLNEIIDNLMQDLIETYRSTYEDVERFSIKEIPLSGIRIFEHVKEHQVFYQLILHVEDLIGFHFILSDQIKTLMLEDCRLVNPSTKLNLELHAQFLAHGLTGLILEWVQGGFQYSTTYMSEQLLEILKDNKVYEKVIDNK